MTTIVALGHVQRSGKSVAARALARDLGFALVGFADPLKSLALESNPLIQGGSKVNVNIGHGRLAHIVHGMGWERAKDDMPEVRRYLQQLGTGARAVFGDHFWVDRFFDQAKRYQRVCAPDLRFENEAEAVKAAGGICIRIDRPGFAGSGHVSETELSDWDGWDAVISNVGDIMELERRIVDLVGPLVSS